ncbi:MAG: membrane protein insertion efficiency factor YidD [Spirochaetia bacterium]|nr:membrane protein insertion efficiency factor YidD [Spirochaetia bacterium]
MTKTKENKLKRRWGIFRSFILLLIRLYKKVLSPYVGNQCRYYPTCSSYAYLCFCFLPMYKAFYYTIKRIFRCHPYCEGGFDYPPGISQDDHEVIDKYLK